MILTTITIIILQINVFSQISLINTYDEAIYITNIEDEGYKYYGINFGVTNPNSYRESKYE